jgi:Replication-relaxation
VANNQQKRGVGWARTAVRRTCFGETKMEREMSEQEPGENKKRSREEPCLLRLMRRDKELLGHVSVARYLTGEQVRRLVFPVKTLATQPKERDAGKQSSAVVCRRRLKALCSEGGGPAYLRRLSFRDAENRPVAVFAVTRLGYSVARQLLRRALPQPTEEVTASFLARTVRLNELYLALAEGYRPTQAPFVWTPANATELPWQELNHRMGRIEERRLAPDAIVELPGQRTRVFLEDEMGVAPLPRRDDAARAWALSKLNRYASFMVEGPRRTFYAQKYPDGWSAELVLLVHSEERASHFGEVIGQWRTLNRAVPLVVHALSFPQAPGLLHSRLDPSDECDPEIPIKRSEMRLTCSFVAEVTATFKAVRHFLRANPAVRGQGCPYPEYSSDFERMITFVERMRGRLETSQ